VLGQKPLQPSGPPHLPTQAGLQVWHCPMIEMQTCPAIEQVPQDPPQPSEPHTLPAQFGVQLPELHWAKRKPATANAEVASHRTAIRLYMATVLVGTPPGAGSFPSFRTV